MSRKNCEISLKVQEIIINHYKEGKTLRSIGEIVGRSHSTIQRIVNLYKDTGDTLSKKRKKPHISNVQKHLKFAKE